MGSTTPAPAIAHASAGGRVIDNINRRTTTVHADVISESFGSRPCPGALGQLLRDANDAVVEAGATAVESSCDIGGSGTAITAADDPIGHCGRCR